MLTRHAWRRQGRHSREFRRSHGRRFITNRYQPCKQPVRHRLCHNSAARRGFAHSCRLRRRTHTDASSAVPFKVTAWVGLRGYASFTGTRRAPIAGRTVKSASGGSSYIVDEEWVWKSGCERNCPRLVLWRDCCVEWCLADTQLHRPRTWNCASPRHVDTSFRARRPESPDVFRNRTPSALRPCFHYHAGKIAIYRFFAPLPRGYGTDGGVLRGVQVHTAADAQVHTTVGAHVHTTAHDTVRLPQHRAMFPAAAAGVKRLGKKTRLIDGPWFTPTCPRRVALRTRNTYFTDML